MGDTSRFRARTQAGRVPGNVHQAYHLKATNRLEAMLAEILGQHIILAKGYDQESVDWASMASIQRLALPQFYHVA